MGCDRGWGSQAGVVRVRRRHYADVVGAESGGRDAVTASRGADARASVLWRGRRVSQRRATAGRRLAPSSDRDHDARRRFVSFSADAGAGRPVPRRPGARCATAGAWQSRPIDDRRTAPCARDARRHAVAYLPVTEQLERRAMSAWMRHPGVAASRRRWPWRGSGRRRGLCRRLRPPAPLPGAVQEAQAQSRAAASSTTSSRSPWWTSARSPAWSPRWVPTGFGPAGRVSWSTGRAAAVAPGHGLPADVNRDGYADAYADQLATIVGQLSPAGMQIILTRSTSPSGRSTNPSGTQPPAGYTKGKYYPFYAPNMDNLTVTGSSASLARTSPKGTPAKSSTSSAGTSPTRASTCTRRLRSAPPTVVPPFTSRCSRPGTPV